MKAILYSFIVLLMPKNEVLGQNPPKVEVQLTTTGALFFTGTKTNTNAGLNTQNADKLVNQITDGDGTKIFNGPENAGKAHGTIEIKMADGGQLSFQTQAGNVSLTNFKADVQGTVASGDVALTDMSGQAQISVRSGNITVEGTETRGIVTTQKGNIMLKNPSNALVATTTNGTIQVQFLATYPPKKAIEYRLERGDMRLTSVTEAVKINLGEGNIDVENVQKGVDLSIEKMGNINIRAVGSGVKALTRKGNISLQIPATTTTNEPTWLQTDQGNISLTLPVGFAGILQLELVQNQEFATEYRITNSANTLNITSQNTLNPAGEIISKRTTVRQVFGSGGRLVRLRVKNGNITINQF